MLAAAGLAQALGIEPSQAGSLIQQQQKYQVGEGEGILLQHGIVRGGDEFV